MSWVLMTLILILFSKISLTLTLPPLIISFIIIYCSVFAHLICCCSFSIKYLVLFEFRLFFLFKVIVGFMFKANNRFFSFISSLYLLSWMLCIWVLSALISALLLILLLHFFKATGLIYFITYLAVLGLCCCAGFL